MNQEVQFSSEQTVSRNKRFRDLRGLKFGKLTVMERLPEKENRYFTWRCRCDWQDSLVYGNYRSCGCHKKEIQDAIQTYLTFLDGTCVEVLSNRKHRCDNTSGFRGIYPTRSGKWKATIGLQSKRLPSWHLRQLSGSGVCPA